MMRLVLLSLAAVLSSSALAQADLGKEDVFEAIGRRLNMGPGSVRAMMKREGVLAQVEALFPAQIMIDSEELLVGEDAYALASTILKLSRGAVGVSLVQRFDVAVADAVEPDQVLSATVAEKGRTFTAACVAILPGRTEATGTRRNHIYNSSARKLTDATPDASTDDEVLRQVQRMIKEMRTSDYVCHVS